MSNVLAIWPPTLEWWHYVAAGVGTLLLVGALLVWRVVLPYTRVEFRPGTRFGYSNPGIVYLGQAILALGNIPVEERSWVYLIRLSAFVLILLAIGWKNRAPR